MKFLDINFDFVRYKWKKTILSMEAYFGLNIEENVLQGMKHVKLN